MAKNYYKQICTIIETGILQEDAKTIQKKMIELSKIHDVNAMKTLYLLIKLQPEIAKENANYLMTNLDYQDQVDRSTICINLANNTVKASYRLLDAMVNSFVLDVNLTDDNQSTCYGYLMAHLSDIYRADNNFHSKGELEKVMVKISKTIAMTYPLDFSKPCYINKHGKCKNYYDLVQDYRQKNSYFLDQKQEDGKYPKMNKLLKNQKEEVSYSTFDSSSTFIKNWESFETDERFTKKKRYNLSTLNFVDKYL